MNVILLDDEDFTSDGTVRLGGRRVQHMKDVLGCAVGDELTVGRINGKLGRGTVTRISAGRAEIGDVVLDRDPPPAVPVTLVLALPRPIVLNRLLAAVTSLGVKTLYLLHTRRVEKSYWHSPVLRPENIEQQFRLGLEQAVDTVPPEIHLRKRFKPFVEDELPGLMTDATTWLAHPGEVRDKPRAAARKAVVIVGPEGGFIPYEVERFDALGVLRLSLGERILRVETAVPVAVVKAEARIKSAPR